MPSKAANAAKRGRDREAKLVDLLNADDSCWAVRAASGVVDVVVTCAEARSRFVQVKSTSRPYEHFGPRERAELLAVCERCDASPWLVWWPLRVKNPVWIPSARWPK
jgi:hypothetical protein